MRAGVADGEYEITYLDLIRIADFNPGQVLRPLQHRTARSVRRSIATIPALNSRANVGEHRTWARGIRRRGEGRHPRKRPLRRQICSVRLNVYLIWICLSTHFKIII